MAQHQKNYDYLIVGGGFAGSITALCLNSTGFSVCLIEKGEHPKFAIGESSTPIADMILRDLSDKYDLPQLQKLSRYGSWQTHYPEVTCGLKRGFSYFKHSKGEHFQPDHDHNRELLVAASVDDINSDTQWYRPETDHLFVRMVQEAGIDYLDLTEIKSVKKSDSEKWAVQAGQNGNNTEISAGFIIDATGSPHFSGQFFGTASTNNDFHTNTRAIYSHFENVPDWYSSLKNLGAMTDDYPYNPDHSALHHLLEPGWLWMLRFNNGLLSAGLVLDGEGEHLKSNTLSADAEWQNIITNYPSLKSLFSGGNIAKLPGKLIKTGRLQRRLDTMTGDGWTALHHTAGFIDPLHSTGIAHSLAGIEKLLSSLIETHSQPTERNKQLKEYEEAFKRELKLIDLLVAGCFKSRHHFELFNAYAMLYFIFSINYEQKRLAGQTPDHFLSADNAELTLITQNCFAKLTSLLEQNRSPSLEEIDRFKDFVIEHIKPFNTVGLMDPSKKNMYEHTAVMI